MSFHDSNSELSQLNRSQGEFLKLHPMTLTVLRLAKYMTRKSKGLFNCFIGDKLVDLGVLPNPSLQLKGPLSFDEKYLEVKGKKARLLKPMCICLDGIAKGYAVDKAIKFLKQNSVSEGYINAGGDLRVFGNCTLPIRRISPEGSQDCSFQLINSALATSWVREQTEAKYPGKILSVTKENKPQLGTWSIVASSAWRADALTKVVCQLPKSQRSEFIESLGGYWLDLEGA